MQLTLLIISLPNLGLRSFQITLIYIFPNRYIRKKKQILVRRLRKPGLFFGSLQMDMATETNTQSCIVNCSKIFFLGKKMASSLFNRLVKKITGPCRLFSPKATGFLNNINRLKSPPLTFFNTLNGSGDDDILIYSNIM